MKLNVGDTVVAMGFGVIGNYARSPEYHLGFAKVLEQRTIDSEPFVYCDLTSIGGENFQVELPVHIFEEENSGVRILSNKEGLKEVYETLSGPTRDHLVDWDDRYREHKKRLFSGDIKQIATVYRELVTLYRTHGLAFGDSKNIEVAKKFLVSEISLVEGISEQEATEKIRAIVGAH